MGSLLTGVCILGSDWSGVECGSWRENICALTQISLLCPFRVGFIFLQWHKSDKIHKCPLLRMYDMLGTSCILSPQCSQQLLEVDAIWVAGEPTKTWRWRLPLHTASRRRSKKSQLNWLNPKLVCVLLYNFYLLLSDHRCLFNIYMSHFRLCFGFKNSFSFTHTLVNDPHLLWKTNLDWPEFQL